MRENHQSSNDDTNGESALVPPNLIDVKINEKEEERLKALVFLDIAGAGLDPNDVNMDQDYEHVFRLLSSALKRRFEIAELTVDGKHFEFHLNALIRAAEVYILVFHDTKVGMSPENYQRYKHFQKMGKGAFSIVFEEPSKYDEIVVTSAQVSDLSRRKWIGRPDELAILEVIERIENRPIPTVPVEGGPRKTEVKNQLPTGESVKPAQGQVIKEDSEFGTSNGPIEETGVPVVAAPEPSEEAEAAELTADDLDTIRTMITEEEWSKARSASLLSKALSTTRLSKLSLAAEKAIPEGLVLQGIVQMLGYKRAPDFNAAEALFTSAAKAGFSRAMRELGLLKDQDLDESGSPRDAYSARQWLTNAADKGCVRGIVDLARHLLQGKETGTVGLLPDKASETLEMRQQEAVKRLEAINDVDAEAKALLGYAYMHGLGVRQSDERGKVLLKRASEAGDGFASMMLGEAFLNGPLPRRSELAFQWIRKAANQNYPGADYFVGWMLWNGYAGDYDPREAIQWFKRAANANDVEATVKLAQAKLEGIAGPVDVPSALALLNNAVELGGSQHSGGGWREANARLGDLYAEGRGVPQDSDQAILYYSAATGFSQSDSGSVTVHPDADPGALVGLGRLFERGQSVPRNRPAAVALFKIAADQVEDLHASFIAMNQLRVLGES